ncbi:hypothetical protein JHK82_012495 [Glycine max]|uniref:Uncharacterized protein n=1 Tax=Glycine max TaxID=3847 RepID=K7KPC8_SOYBN|nr:hypothetical protein JHK87_012412 [Glycine soja]KAG5040374.1 hypothetical protein JHK85_012850 [Glycine max]KAG5057520.1 hypothetical protein JHK86_012516 [Glycine max]KAG5154526.1 hypothetical protein JHK82_012495 [Glycine max]KAH1133680.1 hypothetical protein GYH30_012202 [Glycine max]
MPSSLLCKFYLDFSPTYVGCGLICTHLVNCSVFLGAIISWGFLWPFVCEHAGNWYPVDLGSNDFKGLYGYKVWLTKYTCKTLLMYLHENSACDLYLKLYAKNKGKQCLDVFLNLKCKCKFEIDVGKS